jgi:hypothetical protein
MREREENLPEKLQGVFTGTISGERILVDFNLLQSFAIDPARTNTHKGAKHRKRTGYD